MKRQGIGTRGQPVAPKAGAPPSPIRVLGELVKVGYLQLQFFIASLCFRVPQVSNLRPGKATRWRRFLGPVLILLAAAVAIAPQLVHGNSCGHDFDFHLVSWLDCLNSWRHGIFYPHWAPSANFGAGEPRFVFYPPLTWMLGATLGLALPWPLVPIALTFLLLAATGLATRCAGPRGAW